MLPECIPFSYDDNLVANYIIEMDESNIINIDKSL